MSESSRAEWRRTLFIVLLVSFAAVCAFIGRRGAQITHQKEAVASGHAEWEGRAHGGKWRWRECASCVPTKVTE